MSKPDWLIEAERKRNCRRPDPDTCITCIYLGRPYKLVKHKGIEWTELYECDIHPGCFNTKFSICCDDYTCGQLL